MYYVYVLSMDNKPLMPTCRFGKVRRMLNAAYHFTLFDYLDRGYRFSIKQENLKDFGTYLQDCCEYMLAHGDPI